MDAKKCDTCGKFYERYGGTRTTEFNTMFLFAVTRSNNEIARKEYDLCPECMKKIQDVLKGGRE